LWPAYDQAFAARYADWKDARREVDAALAAPTAEPGRLERAFARLRASQAELEATVQGFVVAAAPHLSADARARIAAIRAPR
ncbi:MAG: periplasmic heavy metal sensor, partial [Rhodospirillales bacterium]